jgi:3-oxoadipate enol-lactonase
MWRGQIEPLSALGRVIVIDGPGHGKSDPPPRFALEEHADALHDAFGELGIHKVALVGLSWGGMVGMRFALQHARQTAGLVLMDTSAEAQTLAEKIRYRAFIAMHRRIGFPYSLFLREVAPAMYGPRTIKERPELLEATYKRTMGMSREGVARASLAVVVHRKNVIDRLGAISAPTLVICGREDQATTLDKSENITNAIPGSRLVVLDGLGHMTAIEDPAAVNAHVVPFVQRILARG